MWICHEELFVLTPARWTLFNQSVKISFILWSWHGDGLKSGTIFSAAEKTDLVFRNRLIYGMVKSNFKRAFDDRKIVKKSLARHQFISIVAQPMGDSFWGILNSFWFSRRAHTRNEWSVGRGEIMKGMKARKDCQLKVALECFVWIFTDFEQENFVTTSHLYKRVCKMFGILFTMSKAFEEKLLTRFTWDIS